MNGTFTGLFWTWKNWENTSKIFSVFCTSKQKYLTRNVTEMKVILIKDFGFWKEEVEKLQQKSCVRKLEFVVFKFPKLDCLDLCSQNDGEPSHKFCEISRQKLDRGRFYTYDKIHSLIQGSLLK